MSKSVNLRIVVASTLVLLFAGGPLAAQQYTSQNPQVSQNALNYSLAMLRAHRGRAVGAPAQDEDSKGSTEKKEEDSKILQELEESLSSLRSHGSYRERVKAQRSLAMQIRYERAKKKAEKRSEAAWEKRNKVRHYVKLPGPDLWAMGQNALNTMRADNLRADQMWMQWGLQRRLEEERNRNGNNVQVVTPTTTSPAPPTTTPGTPSTDGLDSLLGE